MSTHRRPIRSTSIRRAVVGAASPPSGTAFDTVAADESQQPGGSSVAVSNAVSESPSKVFQPVGSHPEASEEGSQLPEDLKRIARIKIRDVLGIEFADLPVGDGLVFVGRNESCKTAFLNSLQAVFDSHARTQMVRWGQDEGSVMLLLDDGSEARRNIIDGPMQPPVLYRPDRTTVGSPATALRRLAPAFLVNPVQFVRMKPPEQVKLLAKVFGIQPLEGEIEAICGTEVDLRDLRSEADGLTKITDAHKAAYDTRHAANSELERVTAARDAERAKIPAGFDAHSVRSVSTRTLAQELADITQKNREIERGHDALVDLKNKHAALGNEIEQCAARLESLKADGQKLKDRMDVGTEWLEKNRYVDPAPLTEKIRNLDVQRALLLAHDTAVQLDANVEVAQARARRLQVVVEQLKALKVNLVQRAAIPIEGLTLDTAGIRVQGLPLDNLSQGAQYTVALRVAAAGAKDLKFICIDGIEALSRDSRAHLLAELAVMKFQVFMTEVSDVDFGVFDLSGKPVDGIVRLAPVGQLTRGTVPGHVDAGHPRCEISAESPVSPDSAGQVVGAVEPALFSESPPPAPEQPAASPFGALSV
jgi:hypothetical protein